MKNHNSRPTGSLAVPEANASFSSNKGRGGGNGRNNSSRRGDFKGPPPKFKNHKKWSAPQHKKNQDPPANPSHCPDDTCHRCGRSGHWSRTCRAPREVAEQYKAYKAAVHLAETNDLEGWNWNTMTSESPPIKITNLETCDFFEDEDDQHLDNETFNNHLGAPPVWSRRPIIL